MPFPPFIGRQSYRVPIIGGGGGGGTYSAWDDTVTHAHVTLTTTTLVNDTAVGAGSNSSRVISILKVAQGAKGKFEFVWNFTDSANAYCSLGFTQHAQPDDWIGSGGYVNGAAIYTDGHEFIYSGGGFGNKAGLAVTSGDRWAVLCDNSNAAAPTMTITNGTTTSDVLDLKPNTDQYAFFEAETTASGKGGQMFTDPATFAISNAGYGAMT